ncbi:phosphate ABC transporter substrate-binding protein [Lusitaniella coriacea LEGE 07157]|uniref:Phosphate ABC transporter substrate-binding protein n=1 Tax=Lusitaniella coriacea LEGE 07157 TaxID=945747 RepID=A0A8J7DZ90_9CYAN|nr:phosphate ABC transporter substrate-binding protein [Lusitaniella coriacea]MBE9117965.1 phosphate ABC transporter substrate-binding protein [Lusitaniella coriacea LEGE 07157]
MSQKNETLPLILALVITLGILGAGFWWFTNKGGVSLGDLKEEQSNENSPSTPQTNGSVNSSTPKFSLPATVPAGTTIRINGSTSMVKINQGLKNSFEQQFSGTTVQTQAQGTGNGINAVSGGSADIAAISRPLTLDEENQGLVAVSVAQDAIALVVGVQNPFRRGLKQQQVIDIFTGKITNWSEISGQTGTIRVINRPDVSGTHQAFKELVLKGANFGNGSNFETMDRDATTPLLRALGTGGIGYATYAQVASQQTVRTVAVDGLTPEAPNYPYQRTLAYVYKEPASPAVQAFLGFASSSEGQRAIADSQ